MFEKFLERWGTEELIKVEGNFSPLIIGSGVSDIFQKELLTYASFDFGGLVILFRRQYGMFFFSMDRYRGSSDAALTEYLAHEGAFRYEEDFKKLWKQAEAWYTAYPPAELEKLPSEELVSLFREISTAFQMFYVYSIFVEAIDKDYIEEHFLEEGGTEEGAERFCEISARPTFDSFALRADEMLISGAPAHETQYVFSSYFITPPIEEIETRKRDLIESRGGVEGITKEIAEIRAELARNKKEGEAYRSTLSPRLQKLFDFMQLCMYMRDIRRSPIDKIVALVSNIARILIAREGLDASYAPFVLPRDISTGSYRTVEGKEEIKHRKEEGVVLYSTAEGNADRFENVPQLQERIAELLRGSDEILAGKTAYPGLVRGKAQIILSEADFPRFEKGNILVTSMTRPEFVPIMKKASAVVTDEGGITCHAAIVSRELKLPCITGTKKATLILKDGDLVEVDAENGIVKKIG